MADGFVGESTSAAEVISKPLYESSLNQFLNEYKSATQEESSAYQF